MTTDRPAQYVSPGDRMWNGSRLCAAAADRCNTIQAEIATREALGRSVPETIRDEAHKIVNGAW